MARTVASITDRTNRANLQAWANDACTCRHRRHKHRPASRAVLWIACLVYGCTCTGFAWDGAR